MVLIFLKLHLHNKYVKVFPKYIADSCIGKLHFRSSSTQSYKALNKILIANRGEIACRIIKTAKQMGIKTVAIYSTADLHSKHVALADESLWIGPSEAKHSYLDMNKILVAIRKSGADGVHPGYGFLSENAAFVEMLEINGITFIGPGSTSIRQMGDKLASKRAAHNAGVSTIPGHDGVIHSAEQCIRVTKSKMGGYPIMIKASAGGGGKGMRIAYNDAEAREGFQLATQEATASFGDGRILIEKFIRQPRHIEIQVICDKYGGAVHLFERECSIQRRNQKVIEEAPSLFLDDVTRRAMGEQAVALCKALGYTSVGTVEFLVDANKRFYFLEMNTRLQVEHPVTECITGIDLVEQMINVAQGSPLNIRQEDIKINGWAIESRIYAEDPYKNFGMPSTGMINKYIEPDHVRCDSGVESGSQINIFYDSMVSKLITHRQTRQEAIQSSIIALDNYVIHGMLNNAALLRDILISENFATGRFHTKYLEEEYNDGFKRKDLDTADLNVLIPIASVLYMAKELRHYIASSQNNELTNMELVVPIQDINSNVKVSVVDGNTFIVSYNNMLYKIENNFNLSQRLLKFKVNNQDVTLQLLKSNSDGSFDVKYKCVKYNLKVIPQRAFDMMHIMKTLDLEADLYKCTKTPMPGLVKQVYCKVGDEIMEGQEICVIEAMKMQNTILSNGTGIIEEVNMKENDTINEDDVLIRLK